jgi:hypothetical protein
MSCYGFVSGQEPARRLDLEAAGEAACTSREAAHEWVYVAWEEKRAHKL